jgi:hypothetical protein
MWGYLVGKEDLKMMYKIIEEFDFNLCGKTVVTECASGPYQYNAVAVAAAGASEVYLVAKNSDQFGSAQDNLNNFFQILKDEKIDVQTYVVNDNTFFNRVDIVTNSGHVRPIDANFLSRINNSCVISLMYEAWEFRTTDIDLGAAEKRKDWITNVNESDVLISTFKYLGILVISELIKNQKLLLNNRILLIGEGPFVEGIKSVLKPLVGNLFCFNNFEEYRNKVRFSRCDAVVIADRRSGQFDPGWNFLSRNPDIFSNDTLFINLSGTVPENPSSTLGYPGLAGFKASRGYMNIHAGKLGMEPVLRLFMGSLKIAALACDFKAEGHNISEANLLFSEHGVTGSGTKFVYSPEELANEIG